MMRTLHSVPGLLIALLIGFLAVSGAFLAVQPALDLAVGTPTPVTQISVALLADRVASQQSGVERLSRKANGTIIAYGNNDTGNWKAIIDPATGLGTPAPETETSALEAFTLELHRSLFLGNRGRILTGFSAIILLVLTVTGTCLLVKRCGGIGNCFTPTRGTLSQRLHIGIGKLTVAGLLLSSATGLYMSLATFGLAPDGGNMDAPYPANVAGTTPRPIAQLEALQQIPVPHLRELIFPFAGDAEDVFAFNSSAGQGYVDQATGSLISFAPNSFGQKLYETVYMLHTGQDGGWISAILALVLGIAAIGLPVLSTTGALIWWKRKSTAPRLSNNDPVVSSDTIILVGSQGNATWGFAEALRNALKASGQKVHLCAMNDVSHEHCQAQNLLVLTSTYGDGDAPASADKFLGKISNLSSPGNARIAVLGFGDTRFPDFCGFAKRTEAVLIKKGFPLLMEFNTINRQCPQTFKGWGVKLSSVLDLELALNHLPQQPKSHQWMLTEIIKNKETEDADIAVLRFALPQTPAKSIAFDAGDLIGITPPGDAAPRFYSLASASQDGFVEICVKRHRNGLCSTHLHSLRPGAKISGFIKTNPLFRPACGSGAIIMIGAGTGMAPFAGFARHNRIKRPMLLFWGGRNPGTDFIYQQQIMSCLQKQHLSRVKPAFSQGPKRQYVQDRVAEDAQIIRAQIANGAQIMVCGGQAMATAVRVTIDQILLPLGISVSQLKQQNRYLEDVY